MICKKCRNKLRADQRFCTHCGIQSPGFEYGNKSAYSGGGYLASNISWIKIIIATLIIIVIVGFGIYGRIDEESTVKNNEALTNFEFGDSQSAISKLKEAFGDAVADGSKLEILKNLGYVYTSEGLYDDALATFKEALLFAKEDTFDYYLVSGEVAYLEYRPNATLLSFNKAYNLKPADFQINNSLAIFYLDLEYVSPQYMDYAKALEYAQKAYDASDLDVKNTATQNLAIAHFFNENYDQTISLLLPQSNDPYISYWLGWSYASKEDEVNAKFYFQRAIDGGVEVEQEVYDYLYSY